MNGIELVCFEIISNVGLARSLFIEAIQSAKEGDYDQAYKLIEQGNEAFVKGHHSHVELIQNEAKGEKTEIVLLLLHAEDQLMSAEAFGILANEFIDLYKKVESKV